MTKLLTLFLSERQRAPKARAEDQQGVQRNRGLVPGRRIGTAVVPGELDIDHAPLDRAVYDTDAFGRRVDHLAPAHIDAAMLPADAHIARLGIRGLGPGQKRIGRSDPRVCPGQAITDKAGSVERAGTASAPFIFCLSDPALGPGNDLGIIGHPDPRGG